MNYPDLSKGSCREISFEFFFPDKGEDAIAQIAKRICRNCPVIKECGDWAIAHEEFGIWGGLTPRDRMVVRKQQGTKLNTLLSGDYL